MKISKGTIVRTIMLVIVLINLVLKHFGIDVINVEESQVLTFVEAVLEVGTIIVAFWKNNSFTDKAIKADNFLKQLKESE